MRFPAHAALGLSLALSVFAAPGARGAEPDPQAFRAAVDAACRAAGAAALDEISATVDPYGSDHYGFALLSGIEKGTRATRSMLCAYDRASRRAEVGSLLDLAGAKEALSDFPVGREAAPAGTAATLIYPNAPSCGQDCLAHWTALSLADQNQLTALPEQVRRTLAEAKPAGEPADLAAARAAAVSTVAAAGGRPDGETAADLVAVPAGDRTCEMLWFGYMGEPSRKVATDRCRVDRLPDGALSVTKTSGENLTVLVRMLGTGLAIVGGRDAPAGPPPGGYDLARPNDPVDPHYGNKVGLAVARPDGRLFIVSIEERGIEPPDPSFFEVIAVGLPKGK
ncbi:hypothetical protein GCM10011390_19340 [Aureimonas endophytica]|uniref:Uncharacterized protein n=1 Tax=Aureimonas endophytica TaxID=2027858 RepID=A0A917E3P8_9HYPH|nr:hypothetical protein [Aureimonas endophytica]GGE00669.1 hypothetical protein GCM10011390_19340 [Aureimonas endophytica]